MTSPSRPIAQPPEELHEPAVGKNVIFYDGVCGFCNKFVQFVIAEDHDGVFYFASLQSDFAGLTLGRRGADPNILDTVYVLAKYGTADEKMLTKSEAVVYTVGQLRPWLRPFATILGIMPKAVRDLGYAMVAKIRYKLFGKYDQCMLPSPETKQRFIAT